jgi:hypothetical protein
VIFEKDNDNGSWRTPPSQRRQRMETTDGRRQESYDASNLWKKRRMISGSTLLRHDIKKSVGLRVWRRRGGLEKVVYVIYVKDDWRRVPKATCKVDSSMCVEFGGLWG